MFIFILNDLFDQSQYPSLVNKVFPSPKQISMDAKLLFVVTAYLTRMKINIGTGQARFNIVINNIHYNMLSCVVVPSL